MPDPRERLDILMQSRVVYDIQNGAVNAWGGRIIEAFAELNQLKMSTGFLGGAVTSWSRPGHRVKITRWPIS